MLTLENKTFKWDSDTHVWRDEDGNQVDLPNGKFSSDDGKTWHMTVGAENKSFRVRWYDQFFSGETIIPLLATWVILTSIAGWSQVHSAEAFWPSFLVFAILSGLRAWRKGRD